MATASRAVAGVRFETARMPNSTELKRLLRALDCLYYAHLFTGQKPYNEDPDVWRAWVGFGFGTGLQQGPPVAAGPDRIRISTFSDGKELTFTVAGGDRQSLEGLLDVLREVEQVRPDLAGPGTDRVQQLLERSPTTCALTEALTAALVEADPADRARIEEAVRTALVALTFPIVTACCVNFPA